MDSQLVVSGSAVAFEALEKIVSGGVVDGKDKHRSADRGASLLLLALREPSDDRVSLLETSHDLLVEVALLGDLAKSARPESLANAFPPCQPIISAFFDAPQLIVLRSVPGRGDGPSHATARKTAHLAPGGRPAPILATPGRAGRSLKR